MARNEWLTDYLIRSGRVTETGATRTAKLRHCRRCPADVLVGLDGDVCAFEVHADPTPLSQLGEALAVLEGRRTLTLRRLGAGFVLDPRDHYDIARRPAGATDRADVLREHTCGSAVTDALAAPSSFAEVTPSAPANAAPPF